jgi:hypothetical protein
VTTQTLTAPDMLGSLDFQPPCTFGHGKFTTAPPCDQTATWVAVRGCCSAVCMWCDTHHVYCTGLPITTGRWACSDCSKLIPHGERFPFVRVERIR